jgi:hypothetical protein
MQASTIMLARFKAQWRELADDSPGERFSNLHERHRKSSTAWLSWLYLGLTVVFLAVGVILSFIPGPAFVFFALAAGLLAIQSRWCAKQLDRGEVVGRRLWKRWREPYAIEHEE